MEKNVNGKMNENGSSARTMIFDIPHEKEDTMKETLRLVYNALCERGYDPINQIVGYLLSEDPAYITNHGGARSLIRRIDRDELLNELVRSYLGV